MTNLVEPLLSWSARLFGSPAPQTPAPLPDALVGARFYARREVKWQAAIVSSHTDRRPGVVPARCLNASELGLLLECEHGFEIGRPVLLQVDEIHLCAHAYVRHCGIQGKKFRVGVEFRDPLQPEALN